MNKMQLYCTGARLCSWLGLLLFAVVEPTQGSTERGDMITGINSLEDTGIYTVYTVYSNCA